MSGKRKAKGQLTSSSTVTMKNNWIFTGTMDSDSVQTLCLTIFDCDRNLNTEVFEYGIVGTRSSLDAKNRDKSLYDVFGYVQIKNHRWSKRDLLRHLVVTVTPYSTNDSVFGAQESKWKPLQVVEHIRLMCTNGSITESGELRKRGSKSNAKKEESSDSAEDDDDYNEEDEAEEEVAIRPARAVVPRTNPFVSSVVLSSSRALAAPSNSPRFNLKPASSNLPARTFSSNGLLNSRASVDRSVPSRPNVARATVAIGNGTKREAVVQSPFVGLKDVLCKQVEESIETKFNLIINALDSKAEEYFNKMEALAEDLHKDILESMYKAISDSFGNQAAVENPIEQEEQYSDPQSDEVIENQENEQ